MSLEKLSTVHTEFTVLCSFQTLCVRKFLHTENGSCIVCLKRFYNSFCLLSVLPLDQVMGLSSCGQLLTSPVLRVQNGMEPLAIVLCRHLKGIQVQY